MNPSQPLNDCELVSALMDGELDAVQAARVVALIATDPSAQNAWRRYHAVGDVMRSPGVGVAPADSALLVSLRARLVQEGEAKTALAAESGAGAPRLVAPLDTEPAPDSGKVGRLHDAANDGTFLWKMLAGAACSLAAFVLLFSPDAGWRSAPESEIAGASSAVGAPQAPAPTLTEVVVSNPGAETQVMLRDSRLDEMLSAHRQLGGTSALQNPSGFLRSATFEGPEK